MRFRTLTFEKKRKCTIRKLSRQSFSCNRMFELSRYNRNENTGIIELSATGTVRKVFKGPQLGQLCAEEAAEYLPPYRSDEYTILIR